MEFNCNSMSKIIVLSVSIKFEELARENIGFEAVDNDYQKIHYSLVLEIVNSILI